MARRLFFVPEIRRGAAELRGEEAHHLTRVLRVECGQKYEISDNQSVYLAEVETARKELVVFRVIERVEKPAAKVRITLYASLFKFDRFEWLVEKVTELGVEAIVPVVATRSDEGLDRAARKRVERWRKIALEASQQSRRVRVAEVREAVPFRDALAAEAGVRLFADEAGTGAGLLQSLPAVREPGATVALLIGPEGGWTDAEREAALAAGWSLISLGEQILRAETAAIVALAVVGAAWA